MLPSPIGKKVNLPSSVIRTTRSCVIWVIQKAPSGPTVISWVLPSFGPGIVMSVLEPTASLGSTCAGAFATLSSSRGSSPESVPGTNPLGRRRAIPGRTPLHDPATV